MAERNYKRHIVVYKNYFIDFKKTLSQQTLKKTYQIFLYIMTLESIPATYLKSIKSVAGLYEIRVEESGNIYRIFCCFDEGNLVVLFNDTGLAASAEYAFALTNVFDGSDGGVHREHLRVHVPAHDCVVYRVKLVQP